MQVRDGQTERSTRPVQTKSKVKDINSMTVAELTKDLKAQRQLLANEKLMVSLPDRGDKVRRRVAQLEGKLAEMSEIGLEQHVAAMQLTSAGTPSKDESRSDGDGGGRDGGGARFQNPFYSYRVRSLQAPDPKSQGTPVGASGAATARQEEAARETPSSPMPFRLSETRAAAAMTPPKTPKTPVRATCPINVSDSLRLQQRILDLEKRREAVQSEVAAPSATSQQSGERSFAKAASEVPDSWLDSNLTSVPLRVFSGGPRSAVRDYDESDDDLAIPDGIADEEEQDPYKDKGSSTDDEERS